MKSKTTKQGFTVLLVVVVVIMLSLLIVDLVYDVRTFEKVKTQTDKIDSALCERYLEKNAYPLAEVCTINNTVTPKEGVIEITFNNALGGTTLKDCKMSKVIIDVIEHHSTHAFIYVDGSNPAFSVEQANKKIKFYTTTTFVFESNKEYTIKTKIYYLDLGPNSECKNPILTIFSNEKLA